MAALILTAAAVLAVFWFKIGMIPTIAACAGAGIIYYFVVYYLVLGAV